MSMNQGEEQDARKEQGLPWVCIRPKTGNLCVMGDLSVKGSITIAER